MKTWLYQLSSPKRFYRLAHRLTPILWGLAIMLLAVGLYAGLWRAPADYQQGDAYRIMFIHVPAAMCSLSCYLLIALSSAIFLIWRTKISGMVSKAAVPVGACFTVLALLTGSLWGKPMWGTYWIWDARLTSELILLFLYFGLFAVRAAIPNQAQAEKVVAIVALVGAIDLPIIHYSVNWWHSLHQGSTLLGFHKPTLSTPMLIPLLLMIGAFISIMTALVLVRSRNELLWRERASQWVRDEVRA